MTTTSQIRSWWAPACVANAADLTPSYKALDACLKKHGYRPRSGVTGAFNCRRITGGTGYSLHAYDPSGIFTFWTGVRVTMALAVDINWDKNPYGPTLVTDMPRAMIADIKAIRTNNGKQLWRWGGDYKNNKDAMHFEIIVSPADLATGIRQQTQPAPPPPEEEEDDMPKPFLCRLSLKSPAVLYVDASRHVHWVRDGEALKGYQLQLRLDKPGDGDKAGDVCVLSPNSPDPNIVALYRMVINLPYIGEMPPDHAAVWVGPRTAT